MHTIKHTQRQSSMYMQKKKTEKHIDFSVFSTYVRVSKTKIELRFFFNQTWIKEVLKARSLTQEARVFREG